MKIPDKVAKGIPSWPAAERPRERILEVGAEALSDAELIALLLRNGVRGKDALGLARELLAEFGGIRGLFAVESKKLKTVKGLGPAKISSLLAVSEIGRRRLREEITGKPFLRDPQTVMSYLYASLRDKKKEVFKILFLNKANCVVSDQDLFEGTLDETAVHLREIIKASLDHHASALILVHNHPSGRVEPSREDIEITRKIQNACQSVGIRILDHLIVGDNQYYSFSEQHLL